jgi:hypothetical protein
MPSAKISDAQFRRDVAKAIHSTDGVWGPDTSKLTKVAGKDLKGKVKAEYNKLAKDFSGADAFTTMVDGKSIYLLTAFDTDVGAGTNVLMDASGKSLKMGDEPHKKLPLPHSEEPAVPVSRAQWLTDLKDAMRFPVQASDTPVIKGAQIPAGVRTIVEKMEATKNYDSIEVHHVRVDGKDSYLVYGNMEDGQSQEMFEANGHKLDVMI